MHVNDDNVTYSDSFGVEHIPKEIHWKIIDKFKKRIQKNSKGKNSIANIYRIQAYDSIICGYFALGLLYQFIRFNQFIFSNEHEKNDKTVLKYFQ